MTKGWCQECGEMWGPENDSYSRCAEHRTQDFSGSYVMTEKMVWPEAFFDELREVREIGQRVSLFAQLRFIALENGWKPGWAAHFYKSIYEAWPDREWEKGAPMRPTDSTYAMVRARQRSYGQQMKQFFEERRAADERQLGLEDGEAASELPSSEEGVGDL